jgi:hypothetical protein
MEDHAAMKSLTTFGLSLAMVAAAGAAELDCGLKTGDSVGAFQVIKAAGALDDSVPVDQQLCYR